MQILASQCQTSSLRRVLRLLPIALALVTASGLLAPADAADRVRSVLFETLRFDDAEALAQADQLVAQGRFQDAIFAFDGLLARSQDDLRDAVVPEKAPGLPFLASEAAPRGALYVGLGSALRRRLQALPPRAKRRYRALLGGEARAAFRRALRTGERAALRNAAERYPLAADAAPHLLALADQALERGDVLDARSLYDLLARDLGQAAQVAARRALVASLAVQARGRHRSALPDPWPKIRTVVLTAPPVLAEEGGSTRQPLDARAAIGAAILSHDGTLALSLSGTLLLGRPAAGARGDRVALEALRAVPPPLGRSFRSPRTPVRFAPIATRHALIALTPLAHRVYGDRIARDLLDGKGGNPFETTLGLLAVDLRREGAVLWTTAEPGSLTATEEEARKLARIEWSTAPVASSGRVLCAGFLPRADRELHLVCFDARRPRVLFRTFICATPSRTRRGGRPTAQTPALAMVDDVALVATASGVLAAVDPATGSVLWLRHVEPPPPGDIRRPFDAAATPTTTRPPVLAVPQGPTPLLVVGGGHGALVQAFDPRTGRRAWRIPSHLRTAVLGTAGRAIVVCDPEALWLADGATGRALTPPLALPAKLRPLPGVFSQPSGPDGQILVVPVVPVAKTRRSSRASPPTALLLVRIAEKEAQVPRLKPVGVYELSKAGAPISLGGGALGLLERGVLRLIRPAQPDGRTRDERLAEVADLYLGPGFETERALATLRKAGRWTLLVPGLRVGGFRFETTEDGSLEARPAEPTKGPAVSIVERPDGEFEVRIATER